MSPLLSIDWPALPSKSSAPKQQKDAVRASAILQAGARRHFESPYAHDHQSGVASVGYAIVTRQGNLRRRVLKRLGAPGERAVPEELQLQIFSHVFQGWRFDHHRGDFEAFDATIERLFAGSDLPVLCRVAHAALQEIATLRYRGSIVNRFDAVDAVEVFDHLTINHPLWIDHHTTHHSLWDEIVNVRLELDTDQVTSLLRGQNVPSHQLAANTHQSPTSMARALRNTPRLRRLTIQVSGENDSFLWTSLSTLHTLYDKTLLAQFMLGLEALVVNKGVKVDFQLSLQHSVEMWWKTHIVWATKMGTGTPVDELCEEMIEYLGQMMDHTHKRVNYEENEEDRVMSD